MWSSLGQELQHVCSRSINSLPFAEIYPARREKFYGWGRRSDLPPVIGPPNLDYWSLLSDDKVYAVVLSHEFAVEMERMFASDLAQSDQIQRGMWGKRPLLQKVKELFAHLFSRWM
jgi:hypothetical protein